ncbi:MAG: outer membrane homotrimeric porin [Desulfomicrobium sp.]|nr:outer membrane homotrimeric porin [Desulfomicrobium sp.]
MKRFTLVALVAALLFGVATMASATELKVRGHLDVYGMWSANLIDFENDEADGDNYMTTQRMRTFFEFVANENLKAVLGLEINNVWGSNWDTEARGAQWGTDSRGNIRVKHAYLDFTLPDTEINVKAGLQYVALPSVFGHPVFEDDAAALIVSAPINDMFGLAVGYSRGYDQWRNDQNRPAYAHHSDNVDMGFLVAPVTMDGWSVAPYFAYARVGQDADPSPTGGQSITTTAFDVPGNIVDPINIWVLGAHATLTMFDPLTFAADLIYGEGRTKYEDAGSKHTYKTRGWYAALAASYKFDFMTATLFGTYASGGQNKENRDRFLPTLAEGWGLTPYLGGVRAFGTAHDSWATDTLGVGSDGTGMWTLGLQLADISFVDNLSHKLVLAFAQGTSHKDVYTDFNRKSNAWEAYMVNKYQIYENLAAINELGYFHPNLKYVSGEDASYFGTIGFKYTF